MFTNTKGGRVGTLLCDGAKHVFSLAVTLDDLNCLSSRLWQLFDAGLVVGDRPPLLFNLHDLEVICDIAEPPSLIPHFFQRRYSLAEWQIFRASAELDYFMFYLSEGLVMDNIGEGEEMPNVVQIGNETDVLEAYYWAKEGLRSPVPKPRRHFPKEIRDILELLDRKRPACFVSASLLLLDMLERHSMINKHETKARAWPGLGILDGEPGVVHPFRALD